MGMEMILEPIVFKPNLLREIGLKMILEPIVFYETRKSQFFVDDMFFMVVGFVVFSLIILDMLCYISMFLFVWSIVSLGVNGG
jgi:hypothetical protein